MGSDAKILWPSDDLDNPGLPIYQQIQCVLVDAVENARLGTAAGAILEQFEGNMPDAQAAPCTLAAPARISRVLTWTNLYRRRSLSTSRCSAR